MPQTVDILVTTSQDELQRGFKRASEGILTVSEDYRKFSTPYHDNAAIVIDMSAIVDTLHQTASMMMMMMMKDVSCLGFGAWRRGSSRGSSFQILTRSMRSFAGPRRDEESDDMLDMQGMCRAANQQHESHVLCG
jgi:hypothetical protein